MAARRVISYIDFGIALRSFLRSQGHNLSRAADNKDGGSMCQLSALKAISSAPERYGAAIGEVVDAGVNVVVANPLGCRMEHLREDASLLRTAVLVAKEVAEAKSTKKRTIRVAVRLPSLDPAEDDLWNLASAAIEAAELMSEAASDRGDLWLARETYSCAHGGAIADAVSDVSAKPLWVELPVDGSLNLPNGKEESLRAGVTSVLAVGPSVRAVIANFAAIHHHPDSRAITEEALDAVRRRIPLGLNVQIGASSCARGFEGLSGEAIVGAGDEIDAESVPEFENEYQQTRLWCERGATVVGLPEIYTLDAVKKLLNMEGLYSTKRNNEERI